MMRIDKILNMVLSFTLSELLIGVFCDKEHKVTLYDFCSEFDFENLHNSPAQYNNLINKERKSAYLHPHRYDHKSQGLGA